MEAVIISRRIVKLPFAAVRRPFAFLYDRVLRRTRAAAPAQDEERAGPGTVPDQAATDATAATAAEPSDRPAPSTSPSPSRARWAPETWRCAGTSTAGRPENIALQRGSDGAWQVTIALEPGHSYRYRYLLDGERWENSWHAERYEPNPFGGTNSVVTIEWPGLAPERPRARPTRPSSSSTTDNDQPMAHARTRAYSVPLRCRPR